MATLDELQAKATQAAEAVASLTAAVTASNDKTDELITVAGATKDALEALRADVANGIVVDPARLDAILAQMDSVVVAAEASKVAVAEQDAQTGAAAEANVP